MDEFSLNFGRKISFGKKSPSKFRHLLLFFAVVFVLAVFLKYIKIFSLTPISPIAKSSSQKISTKSDSSPKTFIDSLEKELASHGGTYSVYIYDLKNNEGFGLNENIIFTAASVNKISILATLYYLAGKKEIDLEKIVVPQPKDIQDYGTGSMRYDPPGTPYSIQTLARLMMEKSDNTAGFILSQLVIGSAKIQNQIETWGLKQTKIEENKTSNYDMLLLMKKIYSGGVTNEALTKEMLGFMDKSDFDDRIPQGLPENVKFYHKTGNEIGKVHDVGIIDLPGRPYYLGVLTTDITDEDDANKTIAKISKMVYEYMKSL